MNKFTKEKPKQVSIEILKKQSMTYKYSRLMEK